MPRAALLLSPAARCKRRALSLSLAHRNKPGMQYTHLFGVERCPPCRNIRKSNPLTPPPPPPSALRGLQPTPARGVQHTYHSRASVGVDVGFRAAPGDARDVEGTSPPPPPQNAHATARRRYGMDVGRRRAAAVSARARTEVFFCASATQ